ncbi:MAG: hypothetical protein ACI4XJ_00290 [Eubacteriales bacterium]
MDSNDTPQQATAENINITQPEVTEEKTAISTEEITVLIDNYLLYVCYTQYGAPRVGEESITVADESDPAIQREFFKVTDDRFDTWEDWTAFLESIFSGDCLEDALANQVHIKNIDGCTYHDDGAMGWNRSPGYTYEINETPNDETTVRIIQKDVFTDEEHITEFICVHTEDGWRFDERVPYHEGN